MIYIDNVRASTPGQLVMNKADISGRLHVAGSRSFRVLAQTHTLSFPYYWGITPLPRLRIKAKAGAMLLLYGSATVFWHPQTDMESIIISATGLTGMQVIGDTYVWAYVKRTRPEPLSWMFPVVCNTDVDGEYSLHVSAPYNPTYLNNLTQLVIEI